MIWHRLNLFIAAGTVIILLVLTAGTSRLVERGERAAQSAAEASLERSAQAVENALNRQLLQVHGALASLPTLFAAANATPRMPTVAGQLLRSLNFQTLAYRDLLLVEPDGIILAAARSRMTGRRLQFDPALLGRDPSQLIGPLRNNVTGDWAVYVARYVPEWNGVVPLAEVPLRTLMELLAETGIPPHVRLFLERPNGQLIASLPHDEVQIGQIKSSRLGQHPPDGTTGQVLADQSRENIVVGRVSLYGDIRVIMVGARDELLADWRQERDRTLAAAAIGGTLVCAFAIALVAALRQHERSEAELARAAGMLVNAIEAMSDGFAMWDAKDRLITCNQRYRDIYAVNAPLLLPGVSFEEVVRNGVRLGQYPEAEVDPESFITQMVAWHHEGAGAVERLLPQGRWVLMKERRTADGGIVGIRSDITTLKIMLAELADANSRANDAADEAQRQNVALTEREAQIRFLAHHDDLTQLPNRILFRDRIGEALRLAREQDLPLALLYIDLDHFKDVNDTLGHPAGDALLRAVAVRLGDTVADPARVARLGGDEFAVFCGSSVQPSEAEELSARIIESLSRPYSIRGHTISISASIGIAVADNTDPEANEDDLLKQADLALYQAKASGRSAHCVFIPAMDAHLRARLDMEADIRRALIGGQFELAYQPIYHLATKALCGFEALLRWRHPQRGMISPATFIPLAEETRLIVEIDNWVLRQACADLAQMRDGLRVAINLSPVEFSFGDIVASVEKAMRESDVEPGRLELEITETALFAHDQRNLNALQQLKRLGVRIVLDDFGTGYSSLSHLHTFPLDKIKIDRSFVRDMTARADSAAIVEAVAALALRLDMTTTAEGIETYEQFDAAFRAGCTEAQGFLLGRPMPLLDALEIANSHNRIEVVRLESVTAR